MSRRGIAYLFGAAVAAAAVTARAENATARYIARTMGRMERSTAERPETVKLLFHGQSITDQLWYRHTVDVLKKRYPTVMFEVENRAIGRHVLSFVPVVPGRPPQIEALVVHRPGR